jgi:hypothetical protein
MLLRNFLVRACFDFHETDQVSKKIVVELTNRTDRIFRVACDLGANPQALRQAPPVAGVSSGLNNAREWRISKLFPRLCHASLDPSYLSDCHL